jgi:hypothetical protein
MLDIDTIRRDLIGLLEQWTGRRHPVVPDTALYHDLGITGDHAREIMFDIAKRYGTSFKGFKFVSYFPKESEPVWNKLARRIGVRRKLKRLTVRHLVAVIVYKSWFEPGAKHATAQRSKTPKRVADQRSA